MNEQVLNESNKEEIINLNQQFSDFLHTKGLIEKLKLAFTNMKKSTKIRHEEDVKNFNLQKEKSIKENQEFYEFLHTKGFKAKCKLVIENIKKGPKEKQNKITEEDLNKEFEIFLKNKNLNNKYTIKIEEIK